MEQFRKNWYQTRHNKLLWEATPKNRTRSVKTRQFLTCNFVTRRDGAGQYGTAYWNNQRNRLGIKVTGWEFQIGLFKKKRL